MLGLRHARTLKSNDDVLAVRITPDGRLIAIALLDATIQARVVTLKLSAIQDQKTLTYLQSKLRIGLI